MEPQAPAAGVTGARDHGAVRRLDHHRPHLAGRLDQGERRRPASGCIDNGVLKADFNSYGSRRGNHEVMMRGTFANVRIKNLMIPPDADGSREEGGVTLFQPGGEKMFIYDAAMKYMAAGHADRDLRRRGVRHRLDPRLGRQGHAAARHQGGGRAQLRAHPPHATWSAWACCRCSSSGSDSWESLGIKGDETIDVVLGAELRPQQDATLVIHRADGSQQRGAR